MLLLIDRIRNEGGAYRRALEDSQKGLTNKPADDERAGRIDNLFEAFM